MAESSVLVVRDVHSRAVSAFIDLRNDTFRRSDVSKILYPLTTPRSHPKADKLADVLMRELARAGKIQRHGHLHWIKVNKDRKLRCGRSVPELDGVVKLPLSTHCPRKWISIDLETGDVWIGDVKGWRRATAAERNDAKAVLA